MNCEHFVENECIKGNGACYEKEGTLGTCPEARSQQILMLSPVGTNSSLYSLI